MSYTLHPAAAREHEEQVAYYESRQAGLGDRYHKAFRGALQRILEAPHRPAVVAHPGVRSVSMRGFPFRVLYRVRDDAVEVLAVAHHRRRPGYWRERD